MEGLERRQPKGEGFGVEAGGVLVTVEDGETRVGVEVGELIEVIIEGLMGVMVGGLMGAGLGA